MSATAPEPAASRPLVVACGALVAELRAVLATNGLTNAVDVTYLPAPLHNRPDRIVDAVRTVLAEHGADTAGARPVLLGYADCGTGGGIDALLAEMPHVRRLPGDHCYAFFAGVDTFASMHAAELGTFFLTDFLAKHFEALVWEGLGLDRHPQLRDMYFGNYEKLVYLAQSDDAELDARAEAAARFLGLAYERRRTGYGDLASSIERLAPR